MLPDSRPKRSAQPIPISLAKINAWQAILVALITTAGGVVGGAWLATRDAKSKTSAVPQQSQCWLTVLGVEGPKENLEGRIIIYCDDVAFSIPSQTAWAKLDRQMDKTRFPLPVNRSVHAVRFEILQKDGRRITSDEVQQFALEHIPTGSESYIARIQDGATFSGIEGARIRFSIDR